jgi:hypothetical protein
MNRIYYLDSLNFNSYDSIIDEPEQQKPNTNHETAGKISIILIATFIIWIVSGWLI